MTNGGVILGNYGVQGGWLESIGWLMLDSNAGKAKIINIELSTVLDDRNKKRK